MNRLRRFFTSALHRQHMTIPPLTDQTEAEGLRYTIARLEQRLTRQRQTIVRQQQTILRQHTVLKAYHVKYELPEDSQGTPLP